MANEISELYKIAAAITLLSEVVSEELGLLLSYLGEDIQKVTESIDNRADTAMRQQ